MTKTFGSPPIDPRALLAARQAADLQVLINAWRLYIMCEEECPERLAEMIDEHMKAAIWALNTLAGIPSTGELPF